MNFLQAVILGLVEGLTEFLPISSTFHLIFAAKFMKIPATDFTKLFEVFIQSGAILAVVIIYFHELKNNVDLMKKVFISFLPTAIVGFLLYKQIKNVFFENESLMLSVFLIVGIIFILIEYLSVGTGLLACPHAGRPGGRPLREISIPHAVLIGLIQSLAVIPGVSRAGSVILGMLLLGYNRSDAAKYSFFLAVPTIFAASAYDLFKTRDLLASGAWHATPLLLAGSLAAFISAFFVIRWFITFLQKNSLIPFGVYRIAVFLILYLSFKFL